jgi:hypothetical protein
LAQLQVTGVQTCALPISPIPFENNLPPSQQLDYQQTEGGLVRRITDGSSEIELNSPTNISQNTFQEKSNIHPL